MFRFNFTKRIFLCTCGLFQYNTCFGSIILSLQLHHLNHYFNTTLVSVQWEISRISKYKCLISIQHLFRFNKNCLCLSILLAVISIQHLFRFNIFRLYFTHLGTYFNTTLVSVQLYKLHHSYHTNLDFNTTLVSVQFIRCIRIRGIVINFNTTLVSVQLWKYNYLLDAKENFNTTLVSVQSTCWNFGRTILTISIQHLFRFNFRYSQSRFSKIKISIQHLFRFNLLKRIRVAFNKLFQYNTCFGSILYPLRVAIRYLISIQHLFRFNKDL